MNRWAAWLQANGPGRFQLSHKAGWDAFVNAAPRAELELLDRRQLAALNEEELEDYTEARMVWNANLPTVKTHQLSAAFAVIDQVMASNRRDADWHLVRQTFEVVRHLLALLRFLRSATLMALAGVTGLLLLAHQKEGYHLVVVALMDADTLQHARVRHLHEAPSSVSCPASSETQ